VHWEVVSPIQIVAGRSTLDGRHPRRRLILQRRHLYLARPHTQNRLLAAAFHLLSFLVNKYISKQHNTFIM